MFSPGKLEVVWDVRVSGDDWSATCTVTFMGASCDVCIIVCVHNCDDVVLKAYF